MLVQFKDYLKTLNVADHYSVGKIDNSKEKSLGVYSSAGGESRIEAIGRESSYDRANVRLLLHWNKNAVETENSARTLFEKIRYITDTQMGDIFVCYVHLLNQEPVFLGTDDNGVYEYYLSVDIYYNRK